MELGAQKESRGKGSSLGMAASGETCGMVTNLVEGHPHDRTLPQEKAKSSSQ